MLKGAGASGTEYAVWYKDVANCGRLYQCTFADLKRHHQPDRRRDEVIVPFCLASTGCSMARLPLSLNLLNEGEIPYLGEP